MNKVIIKLKKAEQGLHLKTAINTDNYGILIKLFNKMKEIITLNKHNIVVIKFNKSL